MYQTKNLGLNITEMPKDKLSNWNFHTDLGHNFESIDEKTLSHRNITNCLLEVPQDIKLELIDGVLTLKESSKVYVPNGFEADGITKKFDEIIINEDITSNASLSGNVQWCIYYRKSLNQLYIREVASSVSGTTAPISAQYMCWYDTTTNIVKRIETDSTNWIITDEISLPIAICTQNSGWKSIDQVFNGFGYIGSTVFALPGVKGLIPNGINEDGSLNNIAYTVSDVSAYTWNASYSGDYENIIFTNSVITGNSGWAEYKEKENVIWDNTTNTSFLALPFCNTTVLNGAITSFTPKQPFRAVDHNDYQTKIAELETKIQTLQAAVEALQG